MKKVLVPVADGFEEIETVTIIDVLRRAGIQVSVAGLKDGVVRGSRRVKLVADATFKEVQYKEFDMVVIPGGEAGVNHLRAEPRFLELLQRYKREDKWIAAICAAPLALRDAGILDEGTKMTSYPSFAGEFSGVDYKETRVVKDKKLLTSRGPGTAMEFSLKIVEVLEGKERAKELKEMMLVRGG